MPGGSTIRTDGRAQTTIDFAVGIGIFLLTVGFVIGVIPGMIDPFDEAEETTLVADRVATQITTGMIAETGRPAVLNETCAFAFFNDSLGEGEGCTPSFSDEDTDLPSRLGIDGSYSVNVTIRRDVAGGPRPDVLCTDGDAVGACSLPGMHTEFSIGPPPSATRSVIAAERTAYVDGKDVTVVVKVW